MTKFRRRPKAAPHLIKMIIYKTGPMTGTDLILQLFVK
jgi:hypothetical protein